MTKPFVVLFHEPMLAAITTYMAVRYSRSWHVPCLLCVVFFTAFNHSLSMGVCISSLKHTPSCFWRDTTWTPVHQVRPLHFLLPFQSTIKFNVASSFPHSGLMFLPLLVGGVIAATVVSSIIINYVQTCPLADHTSLLFTSIQYLIYFEPRYVQKIEQYKPLPVPPEERLRVAVWSGPIYVSAFFWFG